MMAADVVLTWLLVLIAVIFAVVLVGGMGITACEDVLTSRVRRRLLERRTGPETPGLPAAAPPAPATPAVPAAPPAGSLSSAAVPPLVTSRRWPGKRTGPVVATTRNPAQQGLLEYVVESAGFSVN